ncbi:MAG: hypothetical protein HY207_01815 [Nitrospirae bacterium]|nr:hypothetical protein [Nitrospirota bacterium]
MCVSDEFVDRIGDLYQKYGFQMTFGEFLEMVVARMEARYGPSRARRPESAFVVLGEVSHPAVSEKRTRDPVEKASAF